MSRLYKIGILVCILAIMVLVAYAMVVPPVSQRMVTGKYPAGDKVVLTSLPDRAVVVSAERAALVELGDMYEARWTDRNSAVSRR